jgi:hypothetical protein
MPHLTFVKNLKRKAPEEGPQYFNQYVKGEKNFTKNTLKKYLHSIKFTLDIWIQIRIDKNFRIRIRIKSMRTRNLAYMTFIKKAQPQNLYEIFARFIIFYAWMLYVRCYCPVG